MELRGGSTCAAGLLCCCSVPPVKEPCVGSPGFECFRYLDQAWNRAALRATSQKNHRLCFGNVCLQGCHQAWGQHGGLGPVGAATLVPPWVCPSFGSLQEGLAPVGLSGAFPTLHELRTRRPTGACRSMLESSFFIVSGKRMSLLNIFFVINVNFRMPLPFAWIWGLNCGWFVFKMHLCLLGFPKCWNHNFCGEYRLAGSCVWGARHWFGFSLSI